MFAGSATLLRDTDIAKTFFAAHIVNSNKLEEIDTGFECFQLAHFWSPCSIQGDMLSRNPLFINLGNRVLGAHFRFVLLRRQQENSVKPSNRVNQTVFLQLKHDNPKAKDKHSSLRTTQIFNGLQGSKVLFSFESSKRDFLSFSCRFKVNFCCGRWY